MADDDLPDLYGPPRTSTTVRGAAAMVSLNNHSMEKKTKMKKTKRKETRITRKIPGRGKGDKEDEKKTKWKKAQKMMKKKRKRR